MPAQRIQWQTTQSREFLWLRWADDVLKDVIYIKNSCTRLDTQDLPCKNAACSWMQAPSVLNTGNTGILWTHGDNYQGRHTGLAQHEAMCTQPIFIGYSTPHPSSPQAHISYDSAVYDTSKLRGGDTHEAEQNQLGHCLTKCARWIK